MCIQPFRLSKGGLIDRSARLSFNFGGVNLTGYQGDTLSSALIACGLRLRQHSRLGPASLVHDISGDYAFPTVLTDGLTLSRQGAEMNASGKAPCANLEASKSKAPNTSETLTCDIAIIGGGCAGLTAAHTAASTGADVILIDQAEILGGWLLHETRKIDRVSAQDWVRSLADRVARLANVRIIRNATALSVDGHGIVTALIRLRRSATARNSAALSGTYPLNIHARRVIIATGAAELSLDLEGKDKPGIYHSSAVRGYLNRYAVACGKKMLIATNNDSGYLTAFDLADAGLNVAGIVDERRPVRSFIHELAERADIPVLLGAVVRRIRNNGAAQSVEIQGYDGSLISGACDGVALAGGLVPVRNVVTSKAAHPGHDDIVSFAGSCAGAFALQACLSNAAKAGADAAITQGFDGGRPWTAPRIDPLLNIQRVTTPDEIKSGHAPAIANELTAYNISQHLSNSQHDLSEFSPGMGRLYGAAALGLITHINDF